MRGIIIRDTDHSNVAFTMTSRRMLSKKQCVFVIVVLPLLIIPAFVILRMSDGNFDNDVYLLPPPKMAPPPLIKPAIVKLVIKTTARSPMKPKPKKCFDFIWTGLCRDTCYLYNTEAKRRQRKQTVIRCTGKKTQTKITYTTKQKYVLKVPFQDKCLGKVLDRQCGDGRVVPNIVHYVWFGKGEFTFIHFLSFLSVHKFQNPCLILVHADKLPFGPLWNYFLQISDKVIHVRRKQPKKVFKKKLSFVEHRADIAKIEALKEYGGVYLDTDQILLKSIDKYRNFDATIGTDYGATAANSMVIAKKNAEFLKLWLDSYHSYTRVDGNKHSNEIPYKLSQKHRDLVHVVGRIFSSPNAHQLPLLYSRSLDWHHLYGMHMHLKLHDKFYTDKFTMQTVRFMNNTAGAVGRHILYDNTALCT